jgi:hypothetical protein
LKSDQLLSTVKTPKNFFASEKDFVESYQRENLMQIEDQLQNFGFGDGRTGKDSAPTLGGTGNFLNFVNSRQPDLVQKSEDFYNGFEPGESNVGNASKVRCQI